MQKYRVGIIGATGMVGQRFLTLLANHPWFEVTALAASARSAGQTYREAVASRWAFDWPIPDYAADMTILDAAEHRWTKDVPMMVPEVNSDHTAVIEYQRRRLGTKTGFVAVKPNCSIQGYVPALSPLRDFGIKQISVCTYQAISGAGKTFKRWPEMIDNVIPYIGGEEEKSEMEPLKIWGHVENGEIVSADAPVISAQCYRVPVSDGHMAAVSVSFDKKPPRDEIIERWKAFKGAPQELNLPSAPKQFLTYFEEDNRPQTRLDRDLERGMGVSLGRLREDSIFDYKFAALAHNTVRGAAGGAVLTAELLCAQGYIPHK